MDSNQKAASLTTFSIDRILTTGKGKYPESERHQNGHTDSSVESRSPNLPEVDSGGFKMYDKREDTKDVSVEINEDAPDKENKIEDSHSGENEQLLGLDLRLKLPGCRQTSPCLTNDNGDDFSTCDCCDNDSVEFSDPSSPATPSRESGGTDDVTCCHDVSDADDGRDESEEINVDSEDLVTGGSNPLSTAEYGNTPFLVNTRVRLGSTVDKRQH